jgi:hypothetical protein
MTLAMASTATWKSCADRLVALRAVCRSTPHGSVRGYLLLGALAASLYQNFHSNRVDSAALAVEQQQMTRYDDDWFCQYAPLKRAAG